MNRHQPVNERGHQSSVGTNLQTRHQPGKMNQPVNERGHKLIPI